MLGTRFLTACVLFVAIVAGGAPLRVSLASECSHGGVWLPVGACAAKTAACAGLGHKHAAKRAHHDCPCGRHCPPRPSPKAPVPPEPAAPDAPNDGHCHCSDQPLVTGAPLAPVSVDAPALAGWDVATSGRGGLALGVPEVAPSENRLRRVACEEDPIVLLR